MVKLKKVSPIDYRQKPKVEFNHNFRTLKKKKKKIRKYNPFIIGECPKMNLTIIFGHLEYIYLNYP